MGHGSYSIADSHARSVMYKSSSREEIFTKRSLEIKMDPKNTLRECVDSVDHPVTVPIIIGLDVTGSMGHVPDAFIREEMTKMMAGLYAAGLTDAQVLFLGIGDHECDRAPLQAGQFEADDQLLDKWLKDIYLEAGGGGNAGESYLLAWYYAANHTVLDAVTKRGQKGFIFTIGDEANLKSLPVPAQQRIFGDNGSYVAETDFSLLKKAQEKYNVYHLHLTETGRGSRAHEYEGWKQNLGDNCVILDSYKKIAETIIEKVKSQDNSQSVMAETQGNDHNVPATASSGVKEEEML